MKTTVKPFVAALLLASVSSALAAARYVDVNSTNATPPYISWATAATNIQDAVDAALVGDEIVVTNGTYSVGGRSTVDQNTTTNRVVVDKAVNLRSVNGPQFTSIDGGQSNRCVYLTNGASLSGFTLTNGASTRGAAGGGAYGGTLNNCVLSHNTARGRSALGQGYGSGGGAAYSTLDNCTLTGNWVSASDIGSTGGGAYCCTLNNCSLTGNSADNGGGANSSTLNNCTLTGNGASAGASSFGGGASGCTLNNCTLAGNSAVGSELGGGYGGGAFRSTLNNCIVYFNTALQDTNYDSSCVLNYSCTTPLPTNGDGNITNAPLFVNEALGKLRLQLNSPCIDAGFNGYAPGDRDLAGCPRISGGSVDMGAYEFQSMTVIPPRLTITSSGRETILAWPAYAPGFDYTGFTLLYTTNVAFRTGRWNIVHPRPVAVNGQFLVTNAISGSQSFFRLFLGACDMNQDCPSCLRCIIPFGDNFGTCSVYATCKGVVSCANDDF